MQRLSSVLSRPQSSVLNPQSSVLGSHLSPQSSILKCGNQKDKKTLHFCCKNAHKQYFCSQKLDLRHFSRECRKNLNIRTLRIKFRIKSGFEDSPQLVPACYQPTNITCWSKTKQDFKRQTEFIFVGKITITFLDALIC